MAEIKTKKLVIVGDGAIGKTCLLTVFERGEFVEKSFHKLMEESFHKLMEHPTNPGEQFNLQVCQTALAFFFYS